MPPATTTCAAVARIVSSSGGATDRNTKRAVNVIDTAHSNTQTLAATSSSMAAANSGGRPWIAHIAQLPFSFPGETNAVRSPAIVQKAVMPMAARIPSADTAA